MQSYNTSACVVLAMHTSSEENIYYIYRYYRKNKVDPEGLDPNTGIG
jgi:hypothetical protein